MGKALFQTLLTLFIALLISNSHSQAYDAVFAFSWFAGHCKTVGDCIPSIVSLWDHQSFTIHGLWVTRAPNAQRPNYGAFDVSLIKANSTLFDQMMNYWPPKSRPGSTEYFLWEHEWSDHGHDYARVLYALYQNTKYKGLTGVKLNQKLQLDFFTDTVQFYLKYSGVQKYPVSTNIDMKSFTGILKIGTDHATFSCSNGGNIREAKVCIEIRNGGIFTKPCEAMPYVGCSPNVDFYTLEQWKKNPQKRVFNLAATPRMAPSSSEFVEEAVKEEGETDDEDANEAAEEVRDRDEGDEVEGGEMEGGEVEGGEVEGGEVEGGEVEGGEVEGGSGNAENGEVEDSPNDL